ncbi:MAG: pyridoxal-dependent decarboxylase [Gemmatimonadota bacterium]|nr:pyridoxal-dependent decarboxylase [Gemmatimonadota bacterium]MDH3427866.1 pyridoxal-dependent decarboxylase [Gemmatimonadota bacterium]
MRASGQAVGPSDQPDFHSSAHQLTEWIEAYRSCLHELPVLSRVQPGDVEAAIPPVAPESPENFARILSDLDTTIVPGLTHWNHPGFMAYFASSASDPGILAEFVTAALNVNAMLWRTSPAATELESRMVDWVRDFVGLPDLFQGVIQDTASTSTFVALVAARGRAVPDVRELGLAGRSELGQCTVYGSRLAHMSLDKAAIAAGLGHANVRHVDVDERYAMRADALDAALAADRGAGRHPVMVCATLGTTSCTSCDPVAEIADVCAAHGVWLHVDAAYAGPAASLPELQPLFDGWQRADSIVLNPHKWMSVPIDCSVLLGRNLEEFRASLALTPEYLASDTTEHNLMDVGIALGRRFRALKLWFVFRWYGTNGLRAMLRRHCELAREFAARVAADPRLEIAAPVLFSTVCFRAIPPAGFTEGDWNHRLLSAVNREGSIFLSHAELDGRFTIRLTIGSVHTQREHVESAWESVERALQHPA